MNKQHITLRERVLELVTVYEQLPNPILRRLCDQLRAAASVCAGSQAVAFAGEVPALAPSEAACATAADLGRRGGLKGGHARARALTEAQRTASARSAALARWGKVRKTRAEPLGD